MSIESKISVKEKSNSILITDCTGTFNPSNKGGYGTQNFTKSQITDAFIEVQKPSHTEEYPVKINTYPNFPKSVDEFEILPYMIDGDTEIESGKWKFKQTVIFTDSKGKKTTSTAYEVVVFTKNVACCIDKMTAGKLKYDGLNDKKQILIRELSNLLEDVEKQIKCGLYDKANDTINYLKSQCECCGCK